MHIASIACGIVGALEAAHLSFSLSYSAAYGLFVRGNASHTVTLKISPETISSPKLLSLSDSIFVESLSSPLRHTLLGAWFLRVDVGEMFQV